MWKRGVVDYDHSKSKRINSSGTPSLNNYKEPSFPDGVPLYISGWDLTQNVLNYEVEVIRTK